MRWLFALTLPALCTLVAPAQQIQNIVATSAANFEPGLPPPGSIAAIFCTGLTGVSGVMAANQFPLPYSLSGVSVTLGGAPAPIFAVADFGTFQQINVQVPGTPMPATLTISSGSRSGAVLFADFRLSPGDFFQNSNGTGVFQHNSDYSLVTEQNPARSGEAIIAYLTGVGAFLTPINTPAPFDPLAQVPQYSHAAGWSLYSVMLGNTGVTPTYFGLAPGLIGVYQLNFVNPAGGAPMQTVQLVHSTCSGNFFGSCGPHNGHVASSSSAPVLLPVR